MKNKITSLKGEPIKNYQDIFKHVSSWEGGMIDGEAYYTTEGNILIDGKEYIIYRHWSNSNHSLGIYELSNGKHGKHIGNIERCAQIKIKWL
jgi:hypothetical protein